MANIEFSIVLPCLNEAETLETCITKAQACLKRLGIQSEIIVADNGSTDGSIDIATKAGAEVIHVKQKGYGSALLAGIEHAKGTYIIMGDADDSYDFSNLDALIDALRSGNQLVMGNRFKGGIKPGAMPWLHRYVGNPVLSFIGRLFFGGKCTDFHCGLRGFEKKAILDLQLQTTGMEFASEMVVKALLRNLAVTEVSTILYPDGRSRRPHLRTWRDGWRHLRFLLIYSPRWLFLYPGIALMLLGVLGGALILPGKQYIFDVHTLLYCSVFIIVGFTAVQYAIFAKVYATNQELLPHSSFIQKIHKYVTLETGIAIGVTLFLCGLGGSLYALSLWKEENFGALEPTQVLRIIIPSATLIVLGVQIILSSFFLSVLQVTKQNYRSR